MGWFLFISLFMTARVKPMVGAFLLVLRAAIPAAWDPLTLSPV